MEPYNPMYTAVGLDVDGVVADCIGYIYPKIGLSLDNPTWDVPEDKEDAFRAHLSDPATWVSLLVLPDAKNAVRLIYTATGSAPVFISSMPEEFEDLRVWWLRKHFSKVLEDNIFFQCSRSFDKPEAAKNQLLTHFVEDKRTTANAMALAGLTSILVPSNYHNDGDIHPRVQVKSLMEFARDLQTLKEAA